MSIVAHTAESVEQRERVYRDGDVPCVVVILAHPGRQSEHRRHIAGYERLSTVKKGGMAGALRRPQPAKPCFDPNIDKRCDAGTLASGERELARPRIAAVKTVSIEQSGGGADTRVAYVLE